MMDMFLKKADEIFEEAGVPKKGNEEIHQQAAEIMQNCMRNLSITLGMRKLRVDIYEKQCKTLIKDLKKMKKTGEIVK